MKAEDRISHLEKRLKRTEIVLFILAVVWLIVAGAGFYNSHLDSKVIDLISQIVDNQIQLSNNQQEIVNNLELNSDSISTIFEIIERMN